MPEIDNEQELAQIESHLLVTNPIEENIQTPKFKSGEHVMIGNEEFQLANQHPRNPKIWFVCKGGIAYPVPEEQIRKIEPEFIDQNKIIRMNYKKFDKLTRIIGNGYLQIYQNKKGEKFKVLENQIDNQIMILYPVEKSN